MEVTFVFDRHVTGKNHIGRKADLEKLHTLLDDGSNVSIYEPPKTGKSSLLKQAFFEKKKKGAEFRTIEVSLMGCRSLRDFVLSFASSILSVFATTPDEHEEIVRKYLGGTPVTFDAASFSYGGKMLECPDRITEEDFRTVLNFPYEIAKDQNEKVFVIIEEFQNILFIDNAERKLKTFESVVLKNSFEQKDFCSWIWVGREVNAMKWIFEEQRFFHRIHTRLKLSPISFKEAESYLTKSFLCNGKVIETELIQNVYDIFQGHIWYLNHFASICDGLSRGYVTVPIVEQSISALLAINEPRFVRIMNDLTTFQAMLLKAILDGETRFSSAEVIAKYGLNSSANVRRLKDALCKKEIITFEDGRAIILDPLFEYWVRNFYF